jgi:phage protein D
MTAVPIHEGQDFWVPAFEVRPKERASSLPQGVARDITQVTYKDNIDGIDSFDITINNWDAERRTLKYSDTDLFDPGKRLVITMGYRGRDPLRQMISGEITSLRPTFPAAGQPTLTVGGLNLLHTLQGDKVSETYECKTDSKIAEQIGKQRLGIDVELDQNAVGSEKPYGYLIQYNEPDILFLMRRARRVGYELFVKEEPGKSSLYFGPSGRVTRVAYELVYGRSLIEFEPTLSTANQVAEVTVVGWDAKNKQQLSYTAKRAEIATQALGSRAEQEKVERSFATRKEVITDMPVASLEEAKTLAIETLENNAKELVTGSGSVVGLPDLRAGTVVEIDGLGARFRGRYFVTATTHTIGDSGYTTKFECRREQARG